MSILSDLKVKRFEGTLKNGIRVVLLYREGAPVATSAILNSGSQYDPADKPGTAHFIEHMITNGSARFPSKEVLAEHIESVGGSFGARTSQEFMVVDTEIAEKSDYGRVVDMFDATLCSPLMDQKVFENEKKVVIKEIEKSLSNPAQLQIKTGRELFFKNTVLEHQVLGNPESIRAITHEEMLEMHTKLFDKTRISFVVAGDISLQEVVDQLNTLVFKEGNTWQKIAVTRDVLSKQKSLATFFDTTQTHIVFGIPAPVAIGDDMIYLSLLGAILAGGRSARLTKRLRYSKGLIYSVHTSRQGTIEIGEWGIATDTSEDKVQEVLDEIIEEIKDLQKNGVQENELEFVKNRRVRSWRRYTQTSKDWTEFYMYIESYQPNIIDMDEHIEKIKNTTVADIKKVIDIYFVKDAWQLVMVGRTKAEDIIFNW